MSRKAVRPAMRRAAPAMRRRAAPLLLVVLALLAAPQRSQPQYLNTGLLDDTPKRTRVGGQRLLTGNMGGGGGAGSAGTAPDPPPPPPPTYPVRREKAAERPSEPDGVDRGMDGLTRGGGDASQGELTIDDRARMAREKNADRREEIRSRMGSRDGELAEGASERIDHRAAGQTAAGQPAAGWKHDGVPDDSREKQRAVYENLKQPGKGGMNEPSATLADRRAAAAERLAAVRAQNSDRQKNRRDPFADPPPPPPPPPPPASASHGWYSVDDGGAVAFRSGPNMEARTAAVAKPMDLIYAAREPDTHPGWIQTDEGLWLPLSFLVPLTVPPSDLQMERAHAEHTAVAEAAAGGTPPPPPPARASSRAERRAADAAATPPPPPPPPARTPRSSGSTTSPDEVGWYRVDGGGSVAFRSAPSLNERTAAVAKANELIYMARTLPEHPGWLQTEEGLWLPTQFLVPLARDEVPTDADQDAAHDAHGVQADRAFAEAEGRPLPPLPPPSPPARPLPPPPPPPPPAARRLQDPGGAAVGGDDACADSDWKCSTWAQAGECEKDAEFMAKNCKLACGLCAGAAGADSEMERLYAAEAAKLSVAGAAAAVPAAGGMGMGMATGFGAAGDMAAADRLAAGAARPSAGQGQLVGALLEEVKLARGGGGGGGKLSDFKPKAAGEPMMKLASAGDRLY